MVMITQMYHQILRRCTTSQLHRLFYYHHRETSLFPILLQYRETSLFHIVISLPCGGGGNNVGC